MAALDRRLAALVLDERDDVARRRPPRARARAAPGRAARSARSKSCTIRSTATPPELRRVEHPVVPVGRRREAQRGGGQRPPELAAREHPAQLDDLRAGSAARGRPSARGRSLARPPRSRRRPRASAPPASPAARGGRPPARARPPGGAAASAGRCRPRRRRARRSPHPSRSTTSAPRRLGERRASLGRARAHDPHLRAVAQLGVGAACVRAMKPAPSSAMPVIDSPCGASASRDARIAAVTSAAAATARR